MKRRLTTKLGTTAIVAALGLGVMACEVDENGTTDNGGLEDGGLEDGGGDDLGG